MARFDCVGRLVEFDLVQKNYDDEPLMVNGLNPANRRCEASFVWGTPLTYGCV